MSQVNPAGSNVGTSLQQLLMCDDIQPGSDASYQICKTIYEYHPLGAKMAKYPVTIAMSQKREISIPLAPEKAKEAYLAEWRAIGADAAISAVTNLSRVYGVATIAMLSDTVRASEPVAPQDLASMKLAFNVLDPLNTSGSLVMNQNPNAMDFQRSAGITVQGTAYHPSRTVTIMNEEPIFLGYTNSAFGYVGRSVYQRALFPLKSFLQSTITDDLVIVKSGVLVAVMKAAGSIVDQAMQSMFAVKRNVVKEAKTGNVISISDGERIESIDMKNLEGPFALARKNALENIASAADMPAKLLNNETFAEGFGEGAEDAKAVAQYIDKLRETMEPVFSFFDVVAQSRAWSPEFYETVQAMDPENYADKPYVQALFEWRNSFSAVWPSLLTEPESEKVQTDKVKLEAIEGILEVLLPILDPENKATAIMWAEDNFNANKHMFGTPLSLDYDALREYTPPAATMQPGLDADEKIPSPPLPARDDSDRVTAMRRAV